MATLKFRRGLLANLPATAAQGEQLVTTDTHQVYFGTGTGVEAQRVDIAHVLRLLDGGNKIDSAWLPSLAMTNVYVVADLAARDALAGMVAGDVAVVQADANNDGKRQAYIYDGTAWVQMTTATDAVDSVNGQTGAVVLDTDDIAEGATNLYHTTARVNAVIDSRRGAASGVASLGATQKLPSSELASGSAPEFALIESDGAGGGRWVTVLDLGTF